MATYISNSGIPHFRSSVMFVNWNIRGMGSPIKRSTVFAHLRRLKPDLVFLQETRTKDQIRQKCPWVSEVYH